MDKKIGLKKETKTSRGTRQYASPASTLINHPTRLKILEALKNGEKLTTRQLEESTKENRINLYYHLNLLEIEKLITVENKGREKEFQLVQITDQKEIFPYGVMLKLPVEQHKRKQFIEQLNALLSISREVIPNIKLDLIVEDQILALNIQFIKKEPINN